MLRSEGKRAAPSAVPCARVYSVLWDLSVPAPVGLFRAKAVVMVERGWLQLAAVGKHHNSVRFICSHVQLAVALVFCW